MCITSWETSIYDSKDRNDGLGLAAEQITGHWREEDVVRGKLFHMAISDNHKILSITRSENSRLNLYGFKRTTAELTDSCIGGRIGLRVIWKFAM